ncbi:hypothetical protein [Bacillus massiliglaciei]|nr:hypothetical protein [Bacillus massiliglaciei]
MMMNYKQNQWNTKKAVKKPIPQTKVKKNCGCNSPKKSYGYY